MNTYTAPLTTAPHSRLAPDPRLAPAGAVVSSIDYWGRRFALLILLTWLCGIVIGFRSALTILTLMGFAAIVGLSKAL